MPNEIEFGHATRQEYGVYFLSNNNVYDLTIAFLTSFRTYNPTISLCLIPFNGDVEKIELLKDVFCFETFTDLTILNRCDAISVEFHGSVCGAYRKLAMWEGFFNKFIYIDVDTVVLENLEFAFKPLTEYECLTSHSNMPQIREFVWTKNVLESGHLNTEQIGFAANTGFIVSAKKFMSMHWIERSVQQAVQLKDYMVLDCQEQSFLNYLIVTRGKPYSSLYMLRNWYHHHIMLECWGGIERMEIKDGRIVDNNGGHSIFLVHWAGIWRPNVFDLRFNKFLCYIGLSWFSSTINSRLPNKKLWHYYRYRLHTLRGKRFKLTAYFSSLQSSIGSLFFKNIRLKKIFLKH